MTYSQRSLDKALKVFSGHPEGVSFWLIVLETGLSYQKAGEIMADLELEFVPETALWTLNPSIDNPLENLE